MTDDAQPKPSPPASQIDGALDSPVPSHATKVRILVAEDEALIRLDLAEMLVEAGYYVVAQASNG